MKKFSIGVTDARMKKFVPELTAKNPKTGRTLERSAQKLPLPKWWPMEWKDFGKVSISIVDNRGGRGCYLVISQETTLKELSKHHIGADLKLQYHPSCDRSIMWKVPQDVVQNGTKIEESTILIKFKTTDLAEQFKAEFEKHQV